MKKLFGIAVLAAAVMALPIVTNAADAPPAKPDKAEKPEKKAKALPFHGTVASVDKVAKTVTLESKEKPRTFQITSETKIHNKDKKPGTLNDVAVGDHIGGSSRETADGKMELVTLNVLPPPAKK